MIQRKISGEQGITHLLLLVGALGVIFVVGLAGWAVFSHHKKNDPSNNTSGTTSIYGSCMASNRDSRLCEFAAHYVPLNKTSYLATVTVTSPQGTISNLTYESDG